MYVQTIHSFLSDLYFWYLTTSISISLNSKRHGFTKLSKVYTADLDTCSQCREELYLKIKLNWIKFILFKLDSVRSGCPISRARGHVLNARAFRIELEFRNVEETDGRDRWNRWLQNVVNGFEINGILQSCCEFDSTRRQSFSVVCVKTS